MTIALACLIAVGVLVFILSVRAKDLPEPVAVSPFEHLDERKASIYENLRDLQFEYRLGKLSDHDYQQTKADLQRELAGVLAEIDKLKAELGAKGVSAVTKSPKSAAAAAAQAAKPAPAPASYSCPSCKAQFPQPMKFCGECGKPMGEIA